MTVSQGDLIRLPGETQYVKVAMADSSGPGLTLFVEDETPGRFRQVTLDPVEVAQVQALTADGQATSNDVLAAMWAEWMAAAAANTEGAAMISSQLTPYPHQHQAVYGAMIPQPMLRFVLGDEPGTGKTIMAGLVARELQRLGIVSRCLVVCPAHLVTKWQADFERFFGGGLHRVENDTVKTGALRSRMAGGDGFWVVSLELAAMNTAVLEALHPENAGWDLVIFDEAHRLTPTAESYYDVGTVLSGAPRSLLMTATPHRGNEWLFRALMHVADPELYPAPEKGEQYTAPLKPPDTHFLRRLKEELKGHDGQPLFHPRYSSNIGVPLSADEFPFYQQAMDLVDAYFPDEARTLGRMVYGKRAASSLHALRETLRRRHDLMNGMSAPAARRDPQLGNPDGDDPSAGDHAQAVHAGSKNAPAERAAIKNILGPLDAHLDGLASSHAPQSSKWAPMVGQCLEPRGIMPGGDRQLVVFTEYADTADWLVDQFAAQGFKARRYSGRDPHPVRDQVREDFMAGKFQVIVSTDAGNEGIDLQSAQVLVNWDIPWSLVTLEQRMGRIHRVGQHEAVYLFNLVTTDTLEGDTYFRLLERLVIAANELDGKIFDCLSLVGEQLLSAEQLGDGATIPLHRLWESDELRHRTEKAIDAITADRLREAARTELDRERELAKGVRYNEAIRALQEQQIEQINPYIVERYLQRLDGAGLVKVTRSPVADEGLFNLSGTDGFPLPDKFQGGDRTTLVATVGSAKLSAIRSGVPGASRAVDLSPSMDAFRRLVDASAAELRPSLFRGGLVADMTTTHDYDLFVYETEAFERHRRMVWRQLVRVDGQYASAVQFDVLNNLSAVPGETAGGSYHPGWQQRGFDTAKAAFEQQKASRADLLDTWHRNAAHDLDRLPSLLTAGVSSPEERSEIRARARAAIEARKEALASSDDLRVSEPRLLGWCRVRGEGARVEADEEQRLKDSEDVSMRHVTKYLGDAGWHVDDVSRRKVGYDLHARKGVLLRTVEVKGVWGRAASEGIRLTGHEMIRAGMNGDTYWLYVVDRCEDGVGRLVQVIQNPAAKLDGLTRDIAVMSVKGSDLMSVPTAADPT